MVVLGLEEDAGGGEVWECVCGGGKHLACLLHPAG